MSTMTTARTHGDMRTALECDMARINGQSTTTSMTARGEIANLLAEAARRNESPCRRAFFYDDKKTSECFFIFFLLKMKKRNLNPTRVEILIRSHTGTVARQPNNKIVINSFGFMCVAWINKSDTAHHVRDAHVTYVCVKHFYIISSRLSLHCPRTNDILFLPLTAGMLTLSTHLLRSFNPTWRNINSIDTNRSEAETKESHCPPTPDASQCGSCRIVCEYIIHCVWATGFASRNGKCILDAWHSARLLSLNDAISQRIKFKWLFVVTYTGEALWPE